MPVDWIREVSARSMKMDDKPTLTGSRKLRCKVTDRVEDGPADVATAAAGLGIVIGASYDDANGGLKCRSIDIDLENDTAGGGAIYTVTAEYSTESDSKGEDGENTDPDPTER